MYPSDDEKALHREFLRGLSVQFGEILTVLRGGHPQPSPEVMEKEVEDVLRHYILMEKSGISDVISDTGFIMARLMDPYNRNTLTYSMYLTQVLLSFFSSNMKILIDKGIIALVDPPDVEKTWTLSTEHKFLDEELADLDTWNNMMKASLKSMFDDFDDEDLDIDVLLDVDEEGDNE
jgi:hypothetical protein